MTTKINLLLYSEKCQYCKNLMMIMNNENILNNFKLQCVDDIKHTLPRGTIVPTLFVVGIEHPLQGKAAFEWLNSIIQIKRYEMQKKTVVKPPPGPMAYDSSVMSGLSDNFAFADEKINSALPLAYFKYGDEENNAIFTAPETRAINGTQMSKLQSDIKTSRNDFDSEMKRINMQLHEQILRDK